MYCIQVYTWSEIWYQRKQQYKGNNKINRETQKIYICMPVRFINIYLKITILKTFNIHTHTRVVYAITEHQERKKKLFWNKQIKQKVLFT